MRTAKTNVMRSLIMSCALTFAAACALSCGESKKERQQREAIDSLQNANAQGRMDYEDLQGYLTIIANGLDSIQTEEGEIFLNRSGEGAAPNKQQMRQKLAYVGELLNRHRARIDELERQLANGQGDAKKLHTIIVALRQQIDQKDRELEQLRADLNDSRKSVADLKNTVTRMQNIQDEQDNKIQMQEAKIQEQTSQMSRAYVKIASKKQLKEEGLLSGGFLKKKKVNYSNVDLSSFKAIDTRTTRTISVSAKAKIITPVPQGSYTLSGGTLTITNPDQFWSVSNFLIIQAD